MVTDDRWTGEIRGLVCAHIFRGVSDLYIVRVIVKSSTVSFFTEISKGFVSNVKFSRFYCARYVTRIRSAVVVITECLKPAWRIGGAMSDF